MNFEKESLHLKSAALSDEKVDSWPLTVRFLTLMLNMSAIGPAKGPLRDQFLMQISGADYANKSANKMAQDANKSANKMAGCK